MAGEGQVRGGGMEQKWKKDSWTRTTVWALLEAGDVRGTDGNGKKHNKD